MYGTSKKGKRGIIGTGARTTIAKKTPSKVKGKKVMRGKR